MPFIHSFIHHHSCGCVITTLVFTVMFSSTSYAEWTKVTENTNGTTFYVDFERIKKKGDFLYYWQFEDYGDHPLGGKYHSNKSFIKLDCSLAR